MATNVSYKRLAQLYNTMGTDMYHKHMVAAEILKDYVNMDYELPTSALLTLKMPEFLNSTALELAAKKKDIEIFDFLIEHGADFTRKNKQGVTVLHQTIDPNVYNDDSMYWMCNDSQLKNPFAKSVLDAHLKSLNSSNPQDKHGLSHFHVACMLNHAEAVEFFLNSGVSSNQTISNDSMIFPGFTPLHLAAKFGASETLQLLLQTDVKINAKNAKGISALELLMKIKMDIWFELTTAIRFERIREATNLQTYFDLNERMTDTILRKFDPKALVIDETTGLTRFHIVCTTMDSRAVRQYFDESFGEEERLDLDLQHSIKTTSSLWPGYTALHFAAHYEFRVFRILLDEGADLLATDAKGLTPFDICLRNFELHEIKAILLRKDDWTNLRFSDGKTRLLDLVVALQKPAEFEDYLTNNFKDMNVRIADDSPLCPGYTPLHLAVTCCERLGEIRVDGSAIDHFMTFRYFHCFKVCLILGSDVSVKDSRGSTPVHLAFHFHSVVLIQTMIVWEMSDGNPRNNDGMSHLHIASLTDHSRFVEKLPHDCDDLDAPLEIGDFVWAKSSRIKNGATPLSIALSVGARETAEALIERGARMTDDDVERFAKMDGGRLMLQLRPSEYERVLRHCEPRTLVEELEVNAHLRNYLVERHGLTRLHVAVLLVKDVEELTDDVNAKVPIDSPVWPGCTALHLLTVRRRFAKVTTVARMLLDRGANVTLKNARGATPVHEAFDWFMQDRDISSLVDSLLSRSDANPVDARGISHFHVAAIVGKVDVVEGLLGNGVDVDGKIDEFSDMFAGYTALHLAVAFGRDKVVENLLAHGADVHSESIIGDQPMHLAATHGSASEIEGIVKNLIGAGADMNARNLFGETPLEKLLKSDGVTVEKVELFLKYGCRVNVSNPMSHEGCLARALSLKDKCIYKSLINVYDHSKLDEFDRNAMHNIVLLNRPSWDLLKRNTIEELFIPITDYVRVIQELTSMGLDIDFQDMLDMTPLFVAAMHQNVTGIIALLKCGADINVNDTKGFPPITASMSHAHKVTPVSHLDARILEYFWMHIWKLRFFKLQVSNFNLKAESKLQGRKSFRDSVIESCHAEIQSIIKEKIGSIALRDFLCETGVVAAYPTMLYELRSSIDEYFKTNFDRLLEEYPQLSGLLMLQYKKARKRLGMAESCAAALKSLMNFEIPRLCSDRVFRFLTYDDLKNLVASA